MLYYFKVDHENLKIHIINPRTITKIHEIRSTAHKLIAEIIFKISNLKEIRKKKNHKEQPKKTKSRYKFNPIANIIY